jgi:hypothetical protein
VFGRAVFRELLQSSPQTAAAQSTMQWKRSQAAPPE